MTDIDRGSNEQLDVEFEKWWNTNINKDDKCKSCASIVYKAGAELMQAKLKELEAENKAQTEIELSYQAEVDELKAKLSTAEQRIKEAEEIIEKAQAFRLNVVNHKNSNYLQAEQWLKVAERNVEDSEL